ncbi:MAG: hypothetical protein S0880_17565 [Actinomycetota bacterium]|nr:hypothetical protein [Actinomycetota bacterium]
MAAGAELTLPVPCEGRTHRLSWRDGRISPDDHPDVDSDRALAVLGGSLPPCLAQLDLWNEAVRDGGFLEEWAHEDEVSRTRLMWLATALERTRTEGFQEYLRHVPPARAARMARFVVEFPGRWLDHAALAVARRLLDGEPVECPHAPDMLRAGTALRLRRAFVASLAGRGAGVAALVPLRLAIGDDVDPAIVGVLDGRQSRVAIVVGRRWLTDVWGAGLAVTGGDLVLDTDGTRASVVRWAPERRGDRIVRTPTIERAPLDLERAS